MATAFITKQFRAGNSQAVRLPVGIAFASDTKLSVYREGNRVIVEPAEQNLSKVSQLFAQLGEHLIDSDFKRPEFDDTPRQW